LVNAQRSIVQLLISPEKRMLEIPSFMETSLIIMLLLSPLSKIPSEDVSSSVECTTMVPFFIVMFLSAGSVIEIDP